MKRGGLWWQIILVFAIVLAGYLVVFHAIENRRAAKGPWAVTFTGESGVPAIVVNQSTLGIKNVRIEFADERAATNAPQTVEFSQPRPVPFDLPFGKCVFLDPLFLPGTVAFEMFGHEVQLMPRVLTIDKTEQPWKSGATIPVTNAFQTAPGP